MLKTDSRPNLCPKPPPGTQPIRSPGHGFGHTDKIIMAPVQCPTMASGTTDKEVEIDAFDNEEDGTHGIDIPKGTTNDCTNFVGSLFAKCNFLEHRRHAHHRGRMRTVTRIVCIAIHTSRNKAA